MFYYGEEKLEPKALFLSPYEFFCVGYVYSLYKGRSEDILSTSSGFGLETGSLNIHKTLGK